MSIGHSLLIAVRWYVAVSALAWLTYPLLFRVLRPLPDRGLGLLRPLGLWLTVVPFWWLSAWGIIPFDNRIILIGAAALGAGLWAWQLRAAELLSFLRSHLRLLLGYELATAVLFLGYVVWRGYNPAIAYTEKPMELGVLTSAFHSTSMPPPDVWFAGSTINYYYLGYVIYAVPARLAHITPSLAFNLALATLFATAVVAAASVATNLAGLLGISVRLSRFATLLAPLFLVGIGNLVTPLRLLRDPRATLDASWWQGVGWQASRVIVDHPSPGVSSPTINEFPAFSFVLGDLHPHVLAYPLFISSIALGLALVPWCGERERVSWRGRLEPALLAGALGGTLYAINSWDMPSALVMAAVGIVSAGRPLASRANAYLVAALAGAAAIVASPFVVNYVPAVGLPRDQLPAAVRDLPVIGRLGQTFGLVGWPKSSLGQLLEVNGLFILVSALGLVALWLTVARFYAGLGRQVPIVLGVALVLAMLARFPALFLFGVPLYFAVWLWFSDRLTAPMRYLIGLLALTYAMLLLTEFTYLEDAFQDRMNTLFKIYFQAWALFSVMAAVLVPLAAVTLARRLGRAPAIVSLALVALLVLGSAVYPPLSAYRWANGLKTFHGLDGLSYLKDVAPDDAGGIAWLNAHAIPGEHLLEAAGCSYADSAGEPADRVSMATGLPTPLGWEFHEYQWRQGLPDAQSLVDARQRDVSAIYNDPTSPRARRLLDQYQIDYIYVGEFERSGYPNQCSAGPPYSQTGLDALNRLGWPIVYQHGTVTIYARPGAAN